LNQQFAGPWEAWPENTSTAHQGAPQATGSTDPYLYTGEKFPGGLQPVVDILELDYWEIRTRSERLFYSNTYSRGIIRRFVTSIINTGLALEASPEESIIGVDEDSLLDWSEDVENRFFLWGNTPTICDLKGQRGWGQLQRQIYMEALVSGDVLVILRQDDGSKLPQIQIIQGNRIETPLDKLDDPMVIDGVKLDEDGKHVGYYVRTDEMDLDAYEFIPSHGKITGRLQAWLVYGIDKREDGVRGEPILSIAIQPLTEIDKYRDSAQRKAFLNATIIGAVERSDNAKYRSKPVTGAAVKRGSTTATTEHNQSVPTGGLLPGVYFEGLTPGEKAVFYNNPGVDANFGVFEAAIIVGLAWALEMPPEILQLSFNKNYSASQAANSEWKILLDKERGRFGSENNDHIYQDWFLSMALISKISAPGYLEALANPMKWDVARAWTVADWSGSIKPSVDPVKQTTAYSNQCQEGFNSRTRSTREINGQKYSKVIRQLTKDNERLAGALQPLLELEQSFGAGTVAALVKNSPIASVMDEEIEETG
jgi:capsid protein